MSARRWVLLVAVLAAVGLAVAAAVTWSDDDEGSESTTSTTTTSTTTASTSTTSSSVPTSSVSTTTTGTPSGPPAVGEVSAHAGGGSGEVVVDWNTVEGATGYRVLRASTPDGDFTVVADIDVTTGRATAGDEVVNVWSGTHSYIPFDGPLSASDPSASIQYVEVAGPGERCFRIVAYDGRAAASPSAVACGSPP